MSVTQSSSVSAAQPQKFDTQFCVTTNANDAGQLKAVFSKAREARRADDISVDSPTGIDLVESIVQDVERANIRNNIAQVGPQGVAHGGTRKIGRVGKSHLCGAVCGC